MFRLFRLNVPKPLLLFAIAEALILLASVYLGVVIRLFDGEQGAMLHTLSFSGDLLPKLTLFALGMSAVMAATGLYRPAVRRWTHSNLGHAFSSFCIALALMGFAHTVFPGLAGGKQALPLAFLAAFVGVVCGRILRRQRRQPVCND